MNAETDLLTGLQHNHGRCRGAAHTIRWVVRLMLWHQQAPIMPTGPVEYSHRHQSFVWEHKCSLHHNLRRTGTGSCSWRPVRVAEWGLDRPGCGQPCAAAISAR